MTKELKERVNKYDLNKQMLKYISGVEEAYNDLRLSDDNNSENSYSLCEWIDENTNLEGFNNLSERDKFFYGFGFLASEVTRRIIVKNQTK